MRISWNGNSMKLGADALHFSSTVFRVKVEAVVQWSVLQADRLDDFLGCDSTHNSTSRSKLVDHIATKKYTT
jgi:hypothetical protein